MGVCCTKTGAVVRFVEYGVSQPADLFVVDNVVVIRLNPDNYFYKSCDREPTHSVYIGDKGYVDPQRVTFVVPASAIRSLEVEDSNHE